SFPAAGVSVHAPCSAAISPYQPLSLNLAPFPFHSCPGNIFARSRLSASAIIFAWHPRFGFGLQLTPPAPQPNQRSKPALSKRIHPLHPPPQPASPTFA